MTPVVDLGRAPDSWGIAPEPEERLREIASLLATGYLRLLLHSAPDSPIPDVCATCGGEDSAHRGHEDLEVSAAQRDQL